MTSDETIHGADVVMKAIAREAAHHSAASFPAIFDALGRYHRALAEAGLLAPAPLRAMYAEGTKPPGRGWEPLWGVAFNTADKVRERLDGEPGTIIRRFVTDWEEA